MDNIKDTEIQHILVIDDDERLRLLLRRFLEESGFRVTDVASAGDARRLLGGISSAGFARAFRVMLGLLALKLVWDALSGLV